MTFYTFYTADSKNDIVNSSLIFRSSESLFQHLDSTISNLIASYVPPSHKEIDDDLYIEFENDVVYYTSDTLTWVVRGLTIVE